LGALGAIKINGKLKCLRGNVTDLGGHIVLPAQMSCIHLSIVITLQVIRDITGESLDGFLFIPKQATIQFSCRP
jgi:hypothetical protein